MSEKITGYLLLFLGILVIGYSAFSIYQVFTKKSQPAGLFVGQGIKLDLSSLVPSVPGKPPPPPAEVVSADLINDISNLTAHYLLMSFLLTVGFKVASLGVQLLRPIEIKLRSAETKLTGSLHPTSYFSSRSPPPTG